MRTPLTIALGVFACFSLLIAACTTEVIVPSQETPEPSSTTTPEPSSTTPVPPRTSEPPNQRPGTPPAEAPVDVRLTASDAPTAHVHLGNAFAADGKELILVTIALENRGTEALPFALARIELETKAGARLAPFAAASAQASVPCNDVTVLKAKSSTRCSVAYEVQQDAGAKLHYRAANDVDVVTPLLPVARCHDLTHLGTAVTSISSSATLPQPTAEVPPDGTYVAEAVVSTDGSATVVPTTLRVRAGNFEYAFTISGLKVQMTYSARREPNYVSLDLTCVSPAYDDVQKAGAFVSYWDAAGQRLYVPDAATSWVSYRKL